MVDGVFFGLGVINFGVFLVNGIEPTYLLQAIVGWIGLIFSSILFGLAFSKE